MNRLLLLIDDGSATPLSFRATLAAHGWAVIGTTTAHQAFEVATRQRPDAVLLNSSLAGFDTEGFVRRMKWDPLTAAIPILVVRPSRQAPHCPEHAVVELPFPLEWSLFTATLQQYVARSKRQQPYVLVVDDEPDLVDIMLHSLGHEGFLATGAFDGQQALAIAKTIHPDAIVLDLDMPRLNGWEVLKQLRQDQALSSIPVVILTGVAKTEQERHEGLSRGANAYLTKPCPPADVIKTIQSVL